MKWYVVHTYSGQENKVKAYIEDLIERENLQGQIGQVLLPSQDVVQVRHGKKIKQTRKDFPSYVIVELDLNKETMHFITSVPGVTHFVGVGKPQALRQAEVDRILGKMGQDRQEGGTTQFAQIPFKHGDTVRINEGPFKDFDGTVEEVHADKGKLKVMVSVFGRSTPVELNFMQVTEV